MEFRFRKSQQRQPPLLLPVRPLPPAPMAASYIRVGPRRQSLQELETELHEVKIKEEIIARRIAQKRMLEEEARHDREVKHGYMMMERYHRHVPLMIMPPQHQLGPRLISGHQFEQQNPFQGSPAVEVAENLPLIPRASDVETGSEVKLPNKKLAGTKRKAGATVLRPKDWSCALCQVSMTCEDALNDHLKGKKHKANSAQLGSSKKSAAPSMVKATPTREKRGPIGGRTFRMQVDGRVHEVVEKGRFIWCSMCKARCDNEDIMAGHLRGKKHLAKEASKNGEKSAVVS